MSLQPHPTYPAVDLGCTVESNHGLFVVAVRLNNNDSNIPKIVRTIGEDAEAACILADRPTAMLKYGTDVFDAEGVEKFINDVVLFDPAVDANSSALDTFMTKVCAYYESI